MQRWNLLEVARELSSDTFWRTCGRRRFQRSSTAGKLPAPAGTMANPLGTVTIDKNRSLWCPRVQMTGIKPAFNVPALASKWLKLADVDDVIVISAITVSKQKTIAEVIGALLSLCVLEPAMTRIVEETLEASFEARPARHPSLVLSGPDVQRALGKSRSVTGGQGSQGSAAVVPAAVDPAPVVPAAGDATAGAPADAGPAAEAPTTPADLPAAVAPAAATGSAVGAAPAASVENGGANGHPGGLDAEVGVVGGFCTTMRFPRRVSRRWRRATRWGGHGWRLWSPRRWRRYTRGGQRLSRGGIHLARNARGDCKASF